MPRTNYAGGRPLGRAISESAALSLLPVETHAFFAAFISKVPKRDGTFPQEPREIAALVWGRPRYSKRVVVHMARLWAAGIITESHIPDVCRWARFPADGARPHIPEELRRAVHERDGWRCLRCYAMDDLSLDHIRAYSAGGPDSLENLQTLCVPCNSRKGTREA